MAKYLKGELPETSGFSRTNLFAMRKFYLFYSGLEIVHQVGGQLEKKVFYVTFLGTIMWLF